MHWPKLKFKGEILSITMNNHRFTVITYEFPALIQVFRNLSSLYDENVLESKEQYVIYSGI